MARIISCTEPIFIKDEKEQINRMINMNNIDAIEPKTTDEGFEIAFFAGKEKHLWQYNKANQESFDRDIDLLKTNQLQLLNRG